MIDTHIHLDDKQYDGDREEIIERFFEGGGQALINIGAGLGSSARSVALAEEYQNIFASVGLHPHYFMDHGTWNVEHKNQFKELVAKDKVVAIGEIGLDYHNITYNTHHITDIEAARIFQKEGFIFQLEMARELNLPVIIHCRGERSEAGSRFRETGDAYNDTLEIMEKFSDLKYVFHGYGGSLEFTKKVLNKNNIIFSFNGNITYAKPNAEIIDVIREIPLGKIMVETDGPYLTPVPFRGKRNDPLYVQYVIEKIAEIKEISAEKVKEIAFFNAKNFFHIPI